MEMTTPTTMTMTKPQDLARSTRPTVPEATRPRHPPDETETMEAPAATNPAIKAGTTKASNNAG
jgi:hypothetical protein